MDRPTLALAMIVKNEAHNLPALLKSVEGCFDEIHITDTGSTDNTVEVAKSFGAIIHDFKWVGDFSAARNASFAPVKTDYVMWLDGDDELLHRDSFLVWRDTCMMLADYWLATYHYAWDDKTDKPACSFVRERVFKVAKGPRWKYFIHEGVVPNEMSPQPISAQFSHTWAVKHRRTPADLAADRSRNLHILESRKDTLDARMKYYYGKELFENNKIRQSANVLEDAVKDPELELHDRILGLQYLGYATAQLNEFDMSRQYSIQGSQLAPTRAEFFCSIADTYCKENKGVNALPFYSAAKACPVPDSRLSLQAIFFNEAFYTVYPRNQLARIYASSGALGMAKLEAEQCMALYPNPDTKEILDECLKLETAGTINPNATQNEDIVISCPPGGVYEWDADLAKARGMGGSETAAIELAANLHAITKRPVKIINTREKDKTVDGVDYLSNKNIHEYFKDNKPYLHIAWRHNIPVTTAPTLLWCHDLVTQGGDNYRTYNKILALTPFHKRFLMATQGIPEDKIHIFRNGIKPERFKGIESAVKNPNKLVFASSPDRGLDRAMRVMDKVRAKHPDAELHVFYGLENLYKYGLADLAEKLKTMMAERPWVKYHGFTQQDELMRHLSESVVWVHPCDFIETFCITALEMICSGVYPVTRRLGGLMDTLAEAEANGMATLINHDCVTELEYQDYVDAVNDALDKKKWENVKVDPSKYSWEAVTSELLTDLPSLVGG